jgi:Protein of unknown function (DUF3703)
MVTASSRGVEPPDSATATDARAELRRAWRRERALAREARLGGDFRLEWHHLERAHIVSQPIVTRHLATHAAMLSAAVRRRDRREVLGQLARLLLAGPGSMTGRYPVGNTGGADVSAFEPMPVPEDLRGLLDAVTARAGAQ